MALRKRMRNAPQNKSTGGQKKYVKDGQMSLKKPKKWIHANAAAEAESSSDLSVSDVSGDTKVSGHDVTEFRFVPTQADKSPFNKDIDTEELDPGNPQRNVQDVTTYNFVPTPGEKSTPARQPKKRAGSPVTSPGVPKKGKVSNHHKNDLPSTDEVDYTDYVSQIIDSKVRRTPPQKQHDASFLRDYSFSNQDIPTKDSIIATPLKIGFLGLGLMGSGMALNLLRSGHEVTVWNRTPSKCKDFIKDGALKGNSPAEVVQQCDITFSCVSDPAAVKDLVFGNCGVLQGISEGKGYVDMSTVDIETSGDVHEAVMARGGRFLESPVVGTKGPACEGSLVILAAGDHTLYEDCYSCFAAMGKKTFFLGEIGSASKVKLVLQLLTGSVIAGLAESLALAEKVGLDTDELMQILSMHPIYSPMMHRLATDMLQSNYNDPKSKLQVMQKDLRLAVNMSDSVDQPLHVGSSVNELFKKAKAKGYGEHDITAVYRAADL